MVLAGDDHWGVVAAGVGWGGVSVLRVRPADGAWLAEVGLRGNGSHLRVSVADANSRASHSGFWMLPADGLTDGQWGFHCGDEPELAGVSVKVRRTLTRVPGWAFVALGLLVTLRPIQLGLARSRTSRRRAAGRCTACGYDLRATPGRCPECGAGSDH